MKSILLIYIVIILLGCKQKINPTTNHSEKDSIISNNPVKESNKIIETISLDLNNDNKIDSITIYSRPEISYGYNKICINIVGINKQSFTSNIPWVKVDSSFLASNQNNIKSKNIFIKKIKNQTVILLFGDLSGAGYREKFSIIEIKNNSIKMIFDGGEKDDIEIPIKIVDLNKDFKLDFVWTWYKEFEKQVDSLNGDVGSYTPYIIFTLNDSCYTNLELTKKYNEENYVWAGLLSKTTESVRVFYPRNNKQKPKIWKKI